MQEIRVQRFYNEDPPYGLRGFLNDYNNRIMGYGIIRQVRNKRFQCKSPKDLLADKCTGEHASDREDTRDYCEGWSRRGSCNVPEFKYENSTILQTFPYTGRIGTYGGGGYVIHLSGTQSNIQQKFEQLQKTHWIDKYTRAVLLEFSIYNANVNLYATAVVLAEFHAGGGITPKFRFEPIQLRKSEDFTGLVQYTSEVLFVCATVFFTLRELWELKKQKCNYFSSYWNIAEVCIIITSFTTIGVYFWMFTVINNVEFKFRETKGNGYIRLDEAALINQYYVYLIALIMFVSILKLIKLLQFNKRMDVLALTILRCWDELKIFFIAFGIVFFSFSILFFFMFSSALEEFAFFISAIETSFKMMLGKFNFQAMNNANSLSPILFFLFSVF